MKILLKIKNDIKTAKEKCIMYNWRMTFFITHMNNELCNVD